eukprot:3602929-Pyramimonas_sp.AAC.1
MMGQGPGGVKSNYHTGIPDVLPFCSRITVHDTYLLRFHSWVTTNMIVTVGAEWAGFSLLEVRGGDDPTPAIRFLAYCTSST